MEILIEETPNPKALKFIVDRPVKNEGKATFKKGEGEDLALVRDLLALPEVVQVHLFENVISISQSGEQEWEQLINQIKAVIETRLPAHSPTFQPSVVKKSRDHLSPDLQKIEQILDHSIRPGLMADGGDIEILGYNEDVLTVNFQGACGGCPSSTMGTLYAIEGILQQEFNPNIQVRPQIS